MIVSHSHSSLPTPPSSQPSASSAQGDGDVPKLDDLFDGSKAKFGPAYNKYIASTQVPHSIDSKAYYDADADAAEATRYYAGVAGITDPAKKTAALHDLVTSTHKPDPRGYDYVIAKNLYADVDRQPDGTVRNVYGADPITPLQYPDVSFKDLSTETVQQLAAGATVSPVVVGAWLAFQKSAATMNCEHCVPQAYFHKQEPMRSDLNILYAADIHDNSARGDDPYGKFVPKQNKGELARSTMYFMLRYPEVNVPYGPQDLAVLKSWSEADPPNVHERHRNAEVEKLQGNRNPFIDHPEWVKDFQR